MIKTIPITKTYFDDSDVYTKEVFAVTRYIEDWEAHTLCLPTNIAFADGHDAYEVGRRCALAQIPETASQVVSDQEDLDDKAVQRPLPCQR